MGQHVHSAPTDTLFCVWYLELLEVTHQSAGTNYWNKISHDASEGSNLGQAHCFYPATAVCTDFVLRFFISLYLTVLKIVHIQFCVFLDSGGKLTTFSIFHAISRYWCQHQDLSFHNALYRRTKSDDRRQGQNEAEKEQMYSYSRAFRGC